MGGGSGGGQAPTLMSPASGRRCAALARTPCYSALALSGLPVPLCPSVLVPAPLPAPGFTLRPLAPS